MTAQFNCHRQCLFLLIILPMCLFLTIIPRNKISSSTAVSKSLPKLNSKILKTRTSTSTRFSSTSRATIKTTTTSVQLKPSTSIFATTSQIPKTSSILLQKTSKSTTNSRPKITTTTTSTQKATITTMLLLKSPKSTTIVKKSKTNLQDKTLTTNRSINGIKKKVQTTTSANSKKSTNNLEKAINKSTSMIPNKNLTQLSSKSGQIVTTKSVNFSTKAAKNQTLTSPELRQTTSIVGSSPVTPSTISKISSTFTTRQQQLKFGNANDSDFIRVQTTSCKNSGTDADIDVAFRGKNGAYTHFFNLETEDNDFEVGGDQQYYFKNDYASNIDEVLYLYIYFERHGFLPAWMPKSFITNIHGKENKFILFTFDDAANCTEYELDNSKYLIYTGYYGIYHTTDDGDVADIQYLGDSVPADMNQYWDKIKNNR